MRKNGAKWWREKMLPEIQLDQIVGADACEPELVPIPYEDGALPDDQARVLLAILVWANPKTVLEIGTFFGATTLRMAHALPTAKIHTVDLPDSFSANEFLTDFHLINRRLVGLEFRARASRNVVQHFADTMSWDFNGTGLPTFFFIDASHSYQAVKNDSEKCYALCNGAGIFLWHDCAATHPDVVRLLREWRVAGRDIRVIENTTLAFLDSRYVK